MLWRIRASTSTDVSTFWLVRCQHQRVIEPRDLRLEPEAVATLLQLVGIMTDQVMSGDMPRWELDALMRLEVMLETSAMTGEAPLTLGIDDVARLLDGMAFTEMASVELPWFDMVRWTSDFITAELRPYWTDEQWRAHVER
jgi:hypothetical protein